MTANFLAIPPALHNDRKLSDFYRCGSCQKSEWLVGFAKLWCRPRSHVVSEVKNYCDWHHAAEAHQRPAEDQPGKDAKDVG